MILQSLVKYYEQLLEDDTVEIAQPGWCPRSVAFMLDLSLDGELVNIVPAEEKRGWFRMVPEQAKRTVGIEPNLLCDNSSYLLGADAKGKPERSQQCFESAKERHLSFLAEVDSDIARAIVRFFETWEPKEALGNPLVSDCADKLLAGGNLAFRVNKREALEDTTIRDAWGMYCSKPSADSVVMTCLATGKKAPIARLHPAIKGVYGAQSMGASLVGFNARAFESYGHEEEQGLNAPVGEYAAFAYATALNYLISDRNHHIRLGDTTIVFWAERCDAKCAATFSDLLYSAPFDQEKGEADKALEAVMRNMANGTLAREVDFDSEFHVLGLAPNAARISVRFYWHDAFGVALENMRKHYDRLEIVHAPYEHTYLSPYQLLKETANPSAKNPAATSILAGSLMRSILQDQPYPSALYANALLRTWASQDNDDKHTRKVTRGRAAIIKACLMKNHKGYKEATVAVDTESTNPFYTLGRLFSVLVSVQEAANPGIKATISAKYFNSASSTPASVFPLLIKLGQSHLIKLSRDNRGLAVHYTKQIEELCDKLKVFPKRLSLEEQGLFILGYYHQMQDRYTKKDDTQEA